MGMTGLLFFFLTFIFFGVQLINNVVIVSGGQRRDSLSHPHTCKYPFPP